MNCFRATHTHTHTHTPTHPTPNTSCSLADVCKRNCRPVPPLIISSSSSSSSSSSFSPLWTLQTASSSPHFMSFFPHPCLLPPFFCPTVLLSLLSLFFLPSCFPSHFSLPPYLSFSSLPRHPFLSFALCIHRCLSLLFSFLSTLVMSSPCVHTPLRLTSAIVSLTLHHLLTQHFSFSLAHPPHFSLQLFI